jgi:hypothetical protein
VPAGHPGGFVVLASDVLHERMPVMTTVAPGLVLSPRLGLGVV